MTSRCARRSYPPSSASDPSELESPGASNVKQPFELVQDCRRSWWWSAQPFWHYINAEGDGWGTMVDKHPGAFNLAWAMSGVTLPPADCRDYTSRVVWAYTEAIHIPMAGKTMADWSFWLGLYDFHKLLLKERQQIKRWKFHDQDMSYEEIVATLTQRVKERV